jgi:hypothetical protein
MNRKFLVFILCLFSLSGQLSGQTYLYFRIKNPGILRTFNDTFGGYCDNLEFDLEVKASSSSYFYSLEFHLSNDTVALKDLVFSEGPLCDNGYYFLTFNLANGNINLSVASNQPPTSGNPSRFEQISTGWQRLGTFRLRLADPARAEDASWIVSLMEGQQYEKTFSPNGAQLYAGFICEGIPFDGLYLGRIFSSGKGWSQSGGIQNDVPFLDWSYPVNTSVWDSTASLSVPAQIGKLRVHRTAGFILEPTAQVTCYDSAEIQQASGLSILSSPAATGSLISNGPVTYSNNGTVKIEQYLEQDCWHGYCIPVSYTRTQPFRQIHLQMKWYDEPDHVYRAVVDPSGDSVLQSVMQGYLVYSDASQTSQNTVAVTGHLNTGTVAIPVTSTESPEGPDGWNLVGNPYPSAILWPSVTLTNVDPTIYLYDPARGNYVFWNRADDTHSTGISPIVSAMQGFWVHCSAVPPGTGLVAVSNGARVHSNPGFYKAGPSLDNLLILSVFANGFRDEAQVWFTDQATLDFDPVHDVYKKWGENPDAPRLYSITGDSVPAALNVRPWSMPASQTRVQLGYQAGQAGNDTLIASNLASFADTTEIWLEDNQEGKVQRLDEDSVYIFNAAPGDDPARFILYFRYPHLGTNEADPPDPRIYSIEDRVCVRFRVPPGDGIILIIDLTGKEVFRDRLREAELNSFRPGVSEGYYLVRIISGNRVYPGKVFLTE